MTAMLTTILSLISALVPAGTNAALIEKIVAALIQIVPVVVKEYQDLVPIVRNIIGALKADPSTTAAQLEQLQALEVQWDADFEAAAAAAIAEDGAS
ncbi:hypothetical protein LUI11_15225 [Bradyrhizobium diazoefficiens]|uniref:Uncharacterized protein n=1 Tax=Bradyrhizobium diazoefficiens SEMIA 5080 TaxID=754504 RepID=A0A837CL64_9BRAD|nr:hypothetical protein [Bradyrhizobium diazoefficiens]WAX24258.1 hypothetical protein [Bradyrhizobium phage ppBdUSDA122-1]APO53442.1 hypothetical protein BD122_24255 [Bradyrhizobium diazoefficiens]KGJ70029.1 hypothetical protein BJA5080_04205 [Bradyrhizobium diazoefficiens SEMIA 5080]KOY09373.1 hypothetical protein AF336_15485 [Bradyrhizobium diazoefficiens]MCD9294973.1 hypothetical protein [Bradyrhizobium diazoefficiens]